MAVPVHKNFIMLAFFLLSLFSMKLWPESPGGRPISFDDASRMAVAASVDLRNEYAMAAIRERAWILGRRVYLPRLTIGISEDDRLSKTGSDSFYKNYSLSLDQLLWDGGRTSANRRIEKAELNLQGSRIERMAGEIADSALAAYRSVLSARTLAAVRETSWDALAEQRRLLAEEVGLGRAVAMDLTQADLTLSEKRLELLSLKMEMEEAEKRFAEILGLEDLPPLSETVDIQRKGIAVLEQSVRPLAQAQNPELVLARHGIAKKQAEAKYAALSWFPAIRINTGFSLTGSKYPLSRYNWSIGFSIEFTAPYLSGSVQGSAGWEPPYDRTAGLRNNVSPLPDPASALTKVSAQAALALEQSKYYNAFEQAGRAAVMAAEKCRISEARRSLAVEAIGLAFERLRLMELRLHLGQITRLKLMEEQLEYTQKEIAAVEAAVALLEAERELERLLDLRPGELAGMEGKL